MGELFSRFSGSRYRGYYIALLALAVALVFALLLYPRIASSYNAVLDTDHYGAMGYGVWKNATLSYYPDPRPSVNRGPVYPVFIAGMLAATNGWWPQSVQVAQCFLFALTSLLVFRIAETLWNRRVAVTSAFVCALHPFLIWYTSRIWIETLATCLFTTLVAAVLFYYKKPAFSRALVLALVLALCALCKGTFLPFLVIVPFLLAIVRERAIPKRGAFCVFVIAFLLLVPWSLRNLLLTHRFVPVHSLAGFNFQIGDSFIDDYRRAPWSYAALWRRAYGKVRAEIRAMDLADLPLAEQEATSDSLLLRKSLERYLDHPAFLLRKMVYNTLLYWSLGETRLKSLVISIMQVPLLLLFVASAIKVFRLQGIRSIHAIPIFMVGCYFGLHLPIFAFARLSVVLVPVMVIYASAVVISGKDHENLPKVIAFDDF